MDINEKKPNQKNDSEPKKEMSFENFSKSILKIWSEIVQKITDRHILSFSQKKNKNTRT